MRAISGRTTQILTLAIASCALAWSAAPDGVRLVATPNPAGLSVPVTLTADIAPGAIGHVTFYRDTTILGVGDLAGTFDVYFGNGDGTFSPARVNYLPPCTGALKVIAGDFNNDGNLDLALEALSRL
jgi:hypothetical protein